jgi:hypothetical protein
MRNRRFRVNQLLRSPAMIRSSRKLKRQTGKRYLAKPPHIRFSSINRHSNNYNNNTWSYNNNNSNNIRHMNNLIESRRSIQASRPRYTNVGLTPNQAKLFANISARYNNPANMKQAVYTRAISGKNRNTLTQKIRALYE